MTNEMQGNQLRRDLNVIVGKGNNWNIPHFWPFLLRYVSAPILAIIYSFAYPAFYQLRYDPLHIIGFAFAHFSLIIVTLGLIVPRWFNVFVPLERRRDGEVDTVVGVPIEKDEVDVESLQDARASGGSDETLANGAAVEHGRAVGREGDLK